MTTLHGFIMLHRKIMDWEWYDDANVARLFIHLLLLASFKETSWHGKALKPGQVICGRKALGEKLGLSEREVRTALEKLKKTGEITLETTNKYSVVTLVNWALYQNSDTECANKRPTIDHQETDKRPHRNNVNNVNKVNKYMRGAQNTPTGARVEYDYEEIMRMARNNIRAKLGKPPLPKEESA